MSLSRQDKLKIVIARTNEIMKHSYPKEWSIIRYFIETIKNPFVLWEYYKKILLALQVPIIQEPIKKDLYIQDILDDDDLNDEEKEEDIAFRREYHMEATIWFHRAKLGEGLSIGGSTMRMIKDDERTLESFGYVDMDELKNAKTRKIRVVKKVDNSNLIQLECKLVKKGDYRRLEPVGSVIKNQANQIYLPHTQIEDILDTQGRNSDCSRLLSKLMRVIIRYQSCAIGEALRVRGKVVIQRISNHNSELLAKMDIMIETSLYYEASKNRCFG